MWENYSFNEDLLQDAVLELESEKIALKRIIQRKEETIKRLIHQLENTGRPIAKYSIENKPQTMAILRPKLDIRLHMDYPGEYHVIARYEESNLIAFSYHSSINEMTTKQKNGILAYLHEKVVEELKRIC